MVTLFCVFSLLLHRFPQGRSLCGHRERRSNGKSLGVSLIWTLRGLDHNPWPPRRSSCHPTYPFTSLPHLKPEPSPPSFPSTPAHLGPLLSHSPPWLFTHTLWSSNFYFIFFVLLCKLFLDVDRAIKCYTKVFLHGNPKLYTVNLHDVV